MRAALRDVPDTEHPDDVLVPRAYRREDDRPTEGLASLFADRVADYKGSVLRVPAADLPVAVAEMCAARRIRRLGIPPRLPLHWRPDGVELVVDSGLSVAEVDALDGVLTGCTLAIAETGSIVLSGGAHEGRAMLTLVPDCHLCVVEVDQIVGLVPEAIAKLAQVVRRDRSRVTIVSGPSATSDIELSRVEGVHGPRKLDVIICG